MDTWANRGMSGWLYEWFCIWLWFLPSPWPCNMLVYVYLYIVQTMYNTDQRLCQNFKCAADRHGKSAPAMLVTLDHSLFFTCTVGSCAVKSFHSPKFHPAQMLLSLFASEPIFWCLLNNRQSALHVHSVVLSAKQTVAQNRCTIPGQFLKLGATTWLTVGFCWTHLQFCVHELWLLFSIWMSAVLAKRGLQWR